MKKYIYWGALLALVSGVLIFGAVNRTTAKSDQAEARTGTQVGRQAALNGEVNYGGGRGQGAARTGEFAAQGDGRGQGGGRGQGAGLGVTAEGAAQAGEFGGRGGGRGQGGGSGLQEQAGALDRSGAPAEGQEVVMLAGTVAALDDATLEVTGADGNTLLVDGRAWTFAQEAGFMAEVGDAISLAGFYDGEMFEVMTLTNTATGQEVQLREESGRPLWAGGGRNG